MVLMTNLLKRTLSHEPKSGHTCISMNYFSFQLAGRVADLPYAREQVQPFPRHTLNQTGKALERKGTKEIEQRGGLMFNRR